MKQHEAVEQAMLANGGYATLGYLYQAAPKVLGSEWKTKTPFASIRRIVQEDPKFFKIRPGLWALASQREALMGKFPISAGLATKEAEEFGHGYYQGLLVEIGNLRGFQTFIPHQDKNRQFLSRKLSEITTLHQFPLFTYDTLLNRAKTIDVSWFNERLFPDSFFEVEHSTDIQNSLLKFREFQDFRIKFHIVADALRRKEFEKKIAFTAFVPIKSLVQFWDYEKLSEFHSKVFESVAAEAALGA